jgi:aspartyl-tRNA(Asn)/glutamyl-tRNA(Gln) amidotransferase subunit B
MGTKDLTTRTEIKNLNSFRFVQQAIDYEIERQIEILEAGSKVIQETRLYDSDRNETRAMRSKEDAHDYRYFPDPDLLPVELSSEFIESLKVRLPELPHEKRARFIQQYGLPEADATTLIDEPETVAFFEKAVTVDGTKPKLIANWIIGELFGAMRKANLRIEDTPISPTDLGQLVKRIIDNTISGKMAKEIFHAMWKGEGSPDQIIENQGLKQVSDASTLGIVVKEVLRENPIQVEQYKAGKAKVVGFLVGQVMKKTGGKANPKLVNELVKDLI